MITAIVAVLGSLGGLSAVIVALMFFGEIKKRKVLENKGLEIDNLKEVIGQLEKDRDRQQDEINELKKSLRISDAEKIGIERTLNIHKRAINSGIECSIPTSKCPIYNKLIELNK